MAFVFRIHVPESPGRLASARETLSVTDFLLMFLTENSIGDAVHLQPLPDYPSHTAVQCLGDQE